MKSYKTGLLIGLVIGILVMVTLVTACVMSHCKSNNELRGTLSSYDIDWDIPDSKIDIVEA